MQEEGDRWDLTKCCDAHDVCYGTCGSSFGGCEQQFTRCLQRQCNQYQLKEQREPCRSTASLFQVGTRLAGCGFFQQAQRDACVCPGSRGDGEAEHGGEL